MESKDYQRGYDDGYETGKYETEYPDITDFVAENFVSDILDCMDYEDIFKYVQEQEEHKNDGN